MPLPESEATVDVIGELLRASLLSDLGDDPERVSRVREAAQDFGGQLKGGSRALLPNAVLAALDENTAPDTYVLQAAADALLARWETFRNAFAGPPAELLRAVTLTAAVTAAEGDDPLRLAGWYTLRTVVERVGAGPWSDQAASLLASWTEATQPAIAKVWAPPPASTALKMPAVQTDPEAMNFSSKVVVEKAREAAGTANYNTFSQQLMADFEQYTNGLLSFTNATATEAQKRAAAQLKEFAKDLGGKLRDLLSAQEAGTTAARLRTDLLWWRQSAFSDTADAPYTSLSKPEDVAVVAALDLHHMVPPMAPRAVEHLLADLVAAVAGNAGVDLSSLVAAETRSALPEPGDDVSPMLLLDAVVRGGSTPVLPESSSLAAPSASVLLFRDLQVRRLTAATQTGTAS